MRKESFRIESAKSGFGNYVIDIFLCNENKDNELYICSIYTEGLRSVMASSGMFEEFEMEHNKRAGAGDDKVRTVMVKRRA